MRYRTAESTGWRREAIGSVVRSQVTDLWPELRFTLYHLVHSVSGSAGVSSHHALASRLVPVPTIYPRGYQVPARCAFHRPGIDHRQCLGVGHIDSPSPGQPLSPPRRSGAGGPSAEGQSRG